MPSAADSPLAPLVDALAADDRLGPELRHRAFFPGVEARYGEPPEPLPEPIRAALLASGVERLFAHQAEGLAAVARGENVLVTTPTASGKSLVFHLPPLLEAARQRAGKGPGKALFVFPLKALGQDQRGKFNELAKAAGFSKAEASAVVFDGDTPRPERARIKRRPPRVLVTNPDMLHLGILGQAGSWRALLGDLHWIVLDELHVYRGIFGSHFHHVLRRLLRLAEAEGSRPTIIASSATAANAREFAEELTGVPFTVIAESGAPRPGRHVALFGPEASPYSTALRLLIHLLRANQKTIVFTKARRITELLYSWLRRQEPQLARKVASYRSGFLPEERRSIERRLFSGELAGVISTSALELGIDVGGLDAAILVGYPGSVMATWQRSGRAGRGGRESLTAIVALPDALDQYFLEHPAELLERPCERLIVDPGNEPVARAHLVCAAAELGLTVERDGAPAGYLGRQRALVDQLVTEGKLRRVGPKSGDRSEYVSTVRKPQKNVSLRGSGQSYEVIDGGSGEVIGTLDGVRAFFEGHPGAVYLHAGRQYLVDTLDPENHHVVAREADLDYFTSPLTEKETAILEILAARREGPLSAFLVRVQVTERVVGYERKRVQTQEALGQHPLDLPPSSYQTVALLYQAPKAFEDQLREAREHFMGALHATEHAAISLVPLLALCDRGDIGGMSYPFHPQVGCGGVFIYDGHPGGVGIAARAFAELPELLRRVLTLVSSCPCESGCPSCIQSPKCGNGNRPLDKAGAARVLRLLLGEEAAEFELEFPEIDLEAAAKVAAAPRVFAPGGLSEAETSPPGPLSPPPSNPPPGEGEEEDWVVRRGGDVGARSADLRKLVRAPQARRPAAPGAGVSPRTLVFDLETRRSADEVGGWDRLHRLGIAVGVACVVEEGRFEVFREDRVGELVELLGSASLVVGYNVKRFDYAVLAGYTGVDHGRFWPTLDLLEDLERRLGHRVSLNQVAGSTLGVAKSGDGLESLEWVRQGRLEEVESYCRKDVEITRDVYLFGRREGFVRCPGENGEVIAVAVEW